MRFRRYIRLGNLSDEGTHGWNGNKKILGYLLTIGSATTSMCYKIQTLRQSACK